MPNKKYYFDVEQGTSKIKAGFSRSDKFDEIKAIVGANDVTDGDPNVMMRADVSDLGLAYVNFSYLDGTKIKQSGSYIADNKTPGEVRSGLMGKNYNGGKIVSVNFPHP